MYLLILFFGRSRARSSRFTSLRFALIFFLALSFLCFLSLIIFYLSTLIIPGSSILAHLYLFTRFLSPYPFIFALKTESEEAVESWTRRLVE